MESKFLSKFVIGILNKIERVKSYGIALLICLFACIFEANAQTPYGHYISRYIVIRENGGIHYQPIYNPFNISHYGIRVENTNAGVKTWAAEYEGPYNKRIGRKEYLFHKLYLTNQFVFFCISDKPIFRLNNKFYHVVKFDGQVQLAEPRK